MSINITTNKQTLSVCVKEYTSFKKSTSYNRRKPLDSLLNRKGRHTKSVQHDSTSIDFQQEKLIDEKPP